MSIAFILSLPGPCPKEIMQKHEQAIRLEDKSL